jgi:DNA-binding NtrC family response regulator
MQARIPIGKEANDGRVATTRIGRKEVSMAPSVLIADADAELCDLYRQFFSHHGWQVRTSGGGLECLAQLSEFSPRLLIVDVALPWGGADGLLAVMRDDRGLARIPVILTSTGGFPEGLSSLMSLPVVKVLWKPVSLTALFDIVCSELKKRRRAWRMESGSLPSDGLCS